MQRLKFTSKTLLCTEMISITDSPGPGFSAALGWCMKTGRPKNKHLIKSVDKVHLIYALISVHGSMFMEYILTVRSSAGKKTFLI